MRTACSRTRRGHAAKIKPMDINDMQDQINGGGYGPDGQPPFPAFGPEPGPVQFHAERVPFGAVNVPAIILATATATGTHVVFVADPTAVALIEVLFGLLDPDARRVLAARLYRGTSGIVLPGSDGL